jgi:hypothetical protein
MAQMQQTGGVRVKTRNSITLRKLKTRQNKSRRARNNPFSMRLTHSIGKFGVARKNNPRNRISRARGVTSRAAKSMMNRFRRASKKHGATVHSSRMNDLIRSLKDISL